MRKAALLLILAIVVASSACVQQPAANTAAGNASAPKADWDGYVATYLNEYFAANPTFAVAQGKHEYDGKFPDWSNEGIAKRIAWLKAQREKAAAFRMPTSTSGSDSSAIT